MPVMLFYYNKIILFYGVFTMPGYSRDDNSLGCKIVSSFRNNIKLGLPSIYASILLLDADTGIPKAVVDGRQITGWRTAAASAVATKHMHKGNKNILAMFGAGVQAETHALAFFHLFKFKEVRIWNRTKENAERLASRLPFPVKVFDSIDECYKNADVICTTTSTSQPFIRKGFLKPGAHINAVGCGATHYSELEEEVYRNSFLAVEHIPSAEKELKGLLEAGIAINCEVGEIISERVAIPENSKCTVFQSLGLAVEDVTAAHLVYRKYLEKMK